MNVIQMLRPFLVKLLTLCAIITFCRCSYIKNNYGEHCNSHAYLQRMLNQHISSRFHRNAPVRMAVIPFTVPANLSAIDSERAGLGNKLAWQLHAALLSTGEIPIVEVFNREDWPGKREEFFTGNFGALSIAREAAYDLVLVGMLEQQKNLDQITAYTKIMDVDSGITVWYGKTTVTSIRRDLDNWYDTFWLDDKDPAQFYSESTLNKISTCIAQAVINEEELIQEQFIKGN